MVLLLSQFWKAGLHHEVSLWLGFRGFFYNGRHVNLVAFFFFARCFMELGSFWAHKADLFECLFFFYLPWDLLFNYLYNNTQVFLASYKICTAERSSMFCNVTKFEDIISRGSCVEDQCFLPLVIEVLWGKARLLEKLLRTGWLAIKYHWYKLI